MNTALLLVLSIAAPALKEKERPASLVGEWVAEKIIFNGQVDGSPEALRYTFTAEGKWVVVREGKELLGDNRGYKLDIKAKPNTVDFSLDRARTDATLLLGIYCLEGDILTVCLSNDKLRPTEFASPTGQNLSFIVFSRVK